MDTKKIQEITVDKSVLNQLVAEEREKALEQAMRPIYEVAEAINQLCRENWVQIENQDIYYLTYDKLIIEDINRNNHLNHKSNKLAGYEKRLLNYKEARKLFYKEKTKNPLINIKNNANSKCNNRLTDYIRCTDRTTLKNTILDIKTGEIDYFSEERAASAINADFLDF